MAKIDINTATLDELEAALNTKRAEQLQPLKEQVAKLWTELEKAVAQVKKADSKFRAPWQAWLTKERAETAIKTYLQKHPDSTEGQIVKALEGQHTEAKIKKSLATRSTGQRPWFVMDATSKGYSLKVK